MLAARRAYVKLSGPYQISNAGPAYADIAPVARALIQAAPEQAIWGSDWPHTGGANRPLNYNPKDIELFRQEDDGRNLGLLKDWAPSPEIRQKILVDNPGRLFNF
jgi:predicted TIM-barrel fold metal-dependent hydrolase